MIGGSACWDGRRTLEEIVRQRAVAALPSESTARGRVLMNVISDGGKKQTTGPWELDKWGKVFLDTCDCAS